MLRTPQPDHPLFRPRPSLCAQASQPMGTPVHCKGRPHMFAFLVCRMFGLSATSLGHWSPEIRLGLTNAVVYAWSQPKASPRVLNKQKPQKHQVLWCLRNFPEISKRIGNSQSAGNLIFMWLFACTAKRLPHKQNVYPHSGNVLRNPCSDIFEISWIFWLYWFV